MNNQFDELTKSLAQSVTRRAALKKFGVGLAGIVLACCGLTHNAAAGIKKGCLPGGSQCRNGRQCCSDVCGNGYCCRGPGQLCGTGFSMPEECLTDCCSHNAFPRMTFDKPLWICR